jgi:hypothetical protein
MPSLMPEFFILLGIDLSLATSLLTCILDKHFPDKLEYLYQLVALAGFGQLLVTQQFMSHFEEYMRFWYSCIYLFIAVANIIGLNLYLYYKKKKLIARIFSIIGMLPAFSISSMFILNYVTEASYTLIPLPMLSIEQIFLAIFTFDIIVVSVSIYALIKPEWWQVLAPTIALLVAAITFVSLKPIMGETAFIVSSIYIYIMLGIVCIGILGVGVFLLLKFVRQHYMKGGDKKNEKFL